MDYQIVRHVSFQSLSFFGSIALLVAVAFNVGLFGSFGFLFISILNPRDMIMTAFGLVIFLVVFYGTTMAFFTQATLAYEIFAVVRRRRSMGRFLWHLVFAAGSALLIAMFFSAFCLRFFSYRDAEIAPWRMLVMLCIMVVLVLSARFVTSSQRRRTVLLGAVHLVALVAFGIAFGSTVAEVRARLLSTIVLEGGATIEGAIILMTAEGVFYRLPAAGGGFTSHYLPARAVHEIRQ